MARRIDSRNESALSDYTPGRRVGKLIALLGNPNVGKSTIFNHVTGQDVRTAHYSGKTPDINVGTTVLGGETLTVMDLPGAYSLADETEEQWVSRRALLEVCPDVVVVVVDATNLARNLTLVLQVLDIGLPTVVALNLADEALRAGVVVDTEALEALLGVHVVETAAVRGQGIIELMEAARRAHLGTGDAPPHHCYGEDFECALKPLVDTLAHGGVAVMGLRPRPLALQIAEGMPDVLRALPEAGGPGILRVAEESRAALARVTGRAIDSVMARERHATAKRIAVACTERTSPGRPRLETRLLALATNAWTGIPLLVLSLASLLGVLFVVGNTLAGWFSLLWEATASPAIQTVVHRVVGEGVVGSTLLWGLDAGIEASLSIGLPYILTFYVLLGLLEDSGYLNAVAFLTDRAMHHIGLHGRAVIPLVAGAGCSVPAVLSVRVLPTQRERFLAATLVAFVPCSARTAVVLGAVGHYIGWLPALGAFAVSTVVVVVVGVAMDRLVPGEARGFVMEMFAFRRPSLPVVLRKAWGQFREFLVVAIPIVVVGSIVLGGLYETGWLFKLSAPLAPVVTGWLGLPAFAGLTLLLGMLRKEFALQLLVTLAIATTGVAGGELLSFITPSQLFVYAVVNTLALPCVSTIAVLMRVIGVRRTALVVGMTVAVALLVGGVFARVLPGAA